MCPLMRPMMYNTHAYLFMNGDDITEMFFLNGGEAGLVLPRFKNVKYI